MSKMWTNLVRFLFGSLMIFIFGSQIKAQPIETLLKKLSDGREVYQRKHEIESFTDSQNIKETSHSTKDNSEKQQIKLKIEVVLKHPGSKQEEIIWYQEISFLKEERAFNLLDVSDIYVNNSELYLIYFANLDLRVIKLIKGSDGWSSENDTYLEKTSESINPIIETKFMGKQHRIIAKRFIFEFESIIYKWKLKKGKWVLYSEKKVKSKPPWRIS